MDMGCWNGASQKTGVRIHFDQYVIASYAAGAVEVEVPFAGNETMFRTDYIGKKIQEGWAKKDQSLGDCDV